MPGSNAKAIRRPEGHMSASLAEKLVETLRIVLAIVRHHKATYRNELLRASLRAQARRLWHATRTEPGSLRVLGADMSFFNPEAMAILINEVLVDQAYYIDLPSERPFIIDGGANIGLSILLFKRLHPNCRILAFEPDP